MADQTLRLHDLTFEPYLTADRIQQRVRELGAAIQADYADRRPAFLVLLKGAFIFAADLIRACDLRTEVNFVRLASYQGTSSAGTVAVHLPPNPAEIAGRDLIVVEDIVDSGNTLTHFLPELIALQPASISIATLLFKPAALQHELQLDYVGFEIPDRFVVGYGLDYDGLGRSLPAIYAPVP
jgi:hypoxanthine phosphoribosyltransferase